MTTGVLNDVSLSYQLQWNAQRKVAGVMLSLHPHDQLVANACQWVATLQALWHGSSVPLTVTTTSPELLGAWLDQTPPIQINIGVSDLLLQTPEIAKRVLRASQLGLSLMWRGEPGTRPTPALAGCFGQSVTNLTADEALQCLHLSRIPKADSRLSAPVQPGQVVEGVANAALANYCLDQQGASALLGWPTDDVLYSRRQARVQPVKSAVQKLIGLIQADASMDVIERTLSQEPILVYRFLRYVNSAGLGLNRDITSLRHGLMVLGLSRLKTWLQEQRNLASDDLNLQPVTTMMVMRARFMTELLNAGAANELESELELCGLLSQIDLLAGESMDATLHAIPLPERVEAALLGHCGPYWPYLEIAIALENGQPDITRAACSQHGFEEESVNLAMLRTLAAAH